MNTQNFPSSDEPALPELRHPYGFEPGDAPQDQQHNTDDQSALLLKPAAAAGLLSRENSSGGPETQPLQKLPAFEKVWVREPEAEAANLSSTAPIFDLALPHPHLSAVPQRLAAAEARPRSKLRGCKPRAATNDNRASDILLDQFYTRTEIAAYLYSRFLQFFDDASFLMVEPSAGEGSFYRLLPHGSVGYDVDPKYPGIITADFLKVVLPSDRKIAVIGNPPFGRNASMARRFFNHAARQADVIGFILPRTFRKISTENQLNRNFHLLYEETVPENAFLFRSKPHNVPTIFQIWERRPEKREHRIAETRHPDFEFTTPDRADFAIQRVGARAGRVHRDLNAGDTWHYFIKGDVEEIMARLDFGSVVRNTAGNPSLAKAEIVSLYREWISARPR